MHFGDRADSRNDSSPSLSEPEGTDSSRVGNRGSWIVFLCGFLIWTGVQTGLVAVPVWTRALPPEPDDSVSYLVKNRQMEECFFQDCLALKDLREQMRETARDPDVRRQEGLAGSRVFPVYHLLFSALCVGIGRLGFDHVTVYKMVWTAGPFFFGLAFAYLLSALWGRVAAGFAMMMLAFKVFPDTGLHYVVPSNLAMAVGAAMLARVVSRRGDAVWTLLLGSVAVMGMHTVGRLYAVIVAITALAMVGWPLSLRRCWAPLVVLGIVAWTFLGLPLIGNLGFVAMPVIPAGERPGLKLIVSTVETVFAVIAQIQRLESSLLGIVPVFFGAVAIGLLAVPHARRRIISKVMGIYLFFLVALCFYVSSHPADVVLRVWIPFVVMLFGAVGYAIEYAFQESRTALAEGALVSLKQGTSRLKAGWPIVLLAVLTGYSLQMMLTGAVHVLATAEHLRDRQPVALYPSQPALLLSEARPGDRVLYGSMIAMPYYFIHGAMKLGAVYYHPVMAGSEAIARWLARPDLRFAVMLNPTVYHPAFEGEDETQWWITSPEYAHTPLSRRRTEQPIAREGLVPASEFRWIQIEPQEPDFPRTLSILFRNSGKKQRMEVVPTDAAGAVLSTLALPVTVPAQPSGRLTIDLSSMTEARRFRVVLPGGRSSVQIGGIVFGNDTLHWPWMQRADMTFMPKDAKTGPITVSFDPAKILPRPLSSHRIEVLDDAGSSVLFKIEP
jgi:hypothetical protein